MIIAHFSKFSVIVKVEGYFKMDKTVYIESWKGFEQEISAQISSKIATFQLENFYTKNYLLSKWNWKELDCSRYST